MKLKALLFLALATAGAGASFGLTDTGRSAGAATTATTTTSTTTTTTTTTANDACRHFELQGTLASVTPASFTVTVKKGNHTLKGAAGTVVTVAVTAKTRVSWSGQGTLTGPNAGDSVKVNGTQCGGSTGALTASKVQARGPRAKHGDAETTTTTTTTTTAKQGEQEHGKSKGKGKHKD